MTDRAAREARGRRGEMLAAWYLRLMGWRIVGRRIRTPRGEIDLVARRGTVVVFAEVKWRSNAAALAEAIDLYRLRRVAAAAQIAYARYAGPQDTARIDVILIAPWCWPRRIANVWQPGG